MTAQDPSQVVSTCFAGTARFEVLSQLGAGGMGVVYRVLDRDRGIPVALKCMKKLGASALVRFKNEFRALQNVHYPNLVRLGELVQDGDQWFFTMELVEGVDFLSYVRKGESTGRKTKTLRTTDQESESSSTVGAVSSVPKRIGTECIEGRLRSVLRQLTLGLARLHEAGLVHRDIKPSNVLVTEAERVVLLDFGLIADAQDSIWQDRNLVGTVGYMAPEQAGGTGLGPATDWYSVGVLLYVSLTGYPPLGAGGMPPAPHTLDSKVPVDLSRLCLRLLEKDSAKRAGAADILAVLGKDTDSVQGGPVRRCRLACLWAEKRNWQSLQMRLRYRTSASLRCSCVANRGSESHRWFGSFLARCRGLGQMRWFCKPSATNERPRGTRGSMVLSMLFPSIWHRYLRKRWRSTCRPMT